MLWPKDALMTELIRNLKVIFYLDSEYANDPDQKLQIDIEYYKQEILQPWMRIFMHL